MTVQAVNLGLDERLRCATGRQRLNVALVVIEQAAHYVTVVDGRLTIAAQLGRCASLRLGEVLVNVGNLCAELTGAELVIVHLRNTQPVFTQRAVGGELVDFRLVALGLLAQLVPPREDRVHRRGGVEPE